MKVQGGFTDIDPAAVVAREQADVVVGEEIVRHRRPERIVHWTVSLFFFACVLSGMPIWSPIRLMAGFFGGLSGAAGSIPGRASRSRCRPSR
jgi:hypothetical protein